MDPKDVIWKNGRWEVKQKETTTPQQTFLKVLRR